MIRAVPIVIASAALLAPAAASDNAATLPWEKDLKSALKSAKASHRVVMVDFWADWCSWCQQLDSTTYVDPRVVALGQDLIPVKVNTEGSLSEIAASDRYEVSGLPTILFLSPEARVVLRLGRFQGPDEFATTLRAALEAGKRVMAWETALDADGKDAEALAALGAHLFRQRDYQQGRRLLERAMKLDNGRPLAERRDTRRLLARIYTAQKRTGDAERVLAEAQRLGADSAPVPR